MLNNMKEQFVQIFWSLTLLSTFKNASGSGKVTVLLVDYGNSKSQLADGSCCDNLNWCISSCDNFFRLCFASTSSSDKCALWKGWTSVLGGDSFSFSKGSLGNGITNPVTYSFTRWQPIVLDVEVWDDDDGHIVGKDKDFVDHYSLSIRTSPSANLVSARAKRYKLTGPGYSYLNVEVKVFCDANYFIPDCSTYCVPRDDNTGHYICDYMQGRRVCLSGWFGSDCLTYCAARNDTLGHYSCDANGQKQCLSNWYGQDCLVYCKAMNDTLRHYSCDANGQRQCLNNWYGQNCLVYCEPRNDTQGHYMCDSTGNIDCLPRWRGNNCTEAENVTSSSTAISLPAAFSSPLAPAAMTIPIPLMPSSVYSLLRTSIYSVGKSTSLPPKGTVKTSVSSANDVGSATMTSNVSGQSVTRNKIPHISALMTTSTEHSVNTDSAPVLITTWAAVCESEAIESSLISRNSLQMLPLRLTASTELIDLERPETTRVTISLKFHYAQSQSLHRTSLFSQMSPSDPGAEISKMTNSSTRLQRTVLGLIISTPMSQHSSSATVPGGQISVPTNQPAERDKMTFSSLRFYRTSGSQTQTSLSQPSSALNASSLQPDVPSLISTSTVVLPCTTHEVIRTKPTETKEQMISSAVHQRQTFLSVRSLQTMASTLMSASSVALRCATNEEVTALPTAAQPDETSSRRGIMVQFRPVKSDQELGVPWVVRTMKNVLAEQLNSVCRENSKACDLSEEEMFSVWFCPPEVNIELHNVREQGASFKVTAALPPPLNGMVPLQAILEVLKISKKDLEGKTKANITWIPVYGSTTPRSNYKGSGQLSRVSSRESTNPLPYIFGIAGAGLILVVVLLVVRAKLNKRRSRVYPSVEDEMLRSPTEECRSDTIVLLSQINGNYTCKRDKEDVSINRDNDALHLPGAIN